MTESALTRKKTASPQRGASGTSAVAIVGVGAVLPDAANAVTFWANVKDGRYSISGVPEGRWDPDL